MDSLTQIVLGAAVGEVVMGRKLGNRAMVWGAISGTVPDLDIIAYAFMDEIEALAVHRGISHSFFFATLFPFVIGWFTHRVYQTEMYRKRWFRWLGLSIGILIFGAIGAVFNLILSAISGGVNYPVIIMTVVLGFLFFYRIYHRQKRGTVNATEIGYMDWVKLHFWAVFTHPLLDSCTTYGTQLFQPFWDYRVAFNNISVVDPAYTVPFLLFLMAASQLPRGNQWRRIMNGLGIAVSSAYLIWTVNNKFKVNGLFEKSLAESDIQYERYMTSPTILNNVLWYCIADGKDHYYRGFYSLMDSTENITIDSIEKGHDLLTPYEGQRPIEVLKWFSKDYYIVREIDREDADLQYYDVRFGAIGLSNDQGEVEGEFVFGFDINTSGEQVTVNEKRERPSDAKEAFKVFFKRIKGKTTP